jgi:hypothetical protein
MKTCNGWIEYFVGLQYPSGRVDCVCFDTLKEAESYRDRKAPNCDNTSIREERYIDHSIAGVES